MKKLQELLRHVQTIADKNNLILDASGGRFNVFGILGVASSELSHSAFLAELLNPKGSHGLKEKFLESFIAQVLNEPDFYLDYKNVKVNTEFYVGPVTDTSGGQIDILIHEKGERKGIIIENKIYAGDQFAQLIRYDHYGRPKGYKLLYLTLDGSEASEVSCGKGRNMVEYTRISYSEHILKWLEECMGIAIKHPHVRETISQYISIIRELTNQNMDMNTDNEIFDLVFQSEENLEMALKIKHTFSEEMKMNLTYQQLSEIADELGVKIRDDCYMLPPSWKNHWICFSFEGDGLLYGIIRNAEDKTKTRLTEIEEYIGGNWRVSPWWPMYQVMYYKHSDDLWIDLQNGKFKEKAKGFVKKIVDRFGESQDY